MAKQLVSEIVEQYLLDYGVVILSDVNCGALYSCHASTIGSQSAARIIHSRNCYSVVMVLHLNHVTL